jgi:hypothetical protein
VKGKKVGQRNPRASFNAFQGSSRISGKAIANTGFDKKNVVLA